VTWTQKSMSPCLCWNCCNFVISADNFIII
jgi:hypothetical protein